MDFTDLTWHDLDEWAGSRVVGRGKSYRRAVEDLRTTVDGRLVAWVRGGDRYATSVSLDQAGELDSVCTCPYAVACKHAVAMVLVYLDAVKAGKTVPRAAADDERLEVLADLSEAEGLEEDDTGAGDEDTDDDEEGAPAAMVRPRRGRGRSSATDPAAAVHSYLDALDPAALRGLLRELAGQFPAVRQHLAERAELQSGDVAKLVASARREIGKVSAEPGWTRHWSDEGHIPDYSGVRKRLEALLASGHADEVLLLGEEILRRGIEQINSSNDEGETGQEIASCLKVALRALTSSSKSGAERALWEIDVRLRDGYAMLDDTEGLFADPAALTPADWSAVADALSTRLDGMLTGRRAEGGDFDDYGRMEVMRWLLQALEAAGRGAEITAILTREAGITQCYVELVDHLLAAGQDSAAEEWARTGFDKTVMTLSGIAWDLEKRLRELAARRGDLPMVAAFRAMEFFDRPGVDRYTAVQQATTGLGLWDVVRPMLLGWLETGRRPDGPLPALTPRRGKARTAPTSDADSQLPWPLPPTGLRVPKGERVHLSFPDTTTLIAIAIHERRNDDVLRWYRMDAKRGQDWGGHLSTTVADAVQKTHPDEALAIWERLARAEMDLTKPAAYAAAGAFLAQMREVYQRTGRLTEWEQLLASLREEHKRKPRLVEVLDRLAGKRSRILDG